MKKLCSVVPVVVVVLGCLWFPLGGCAGGGELETASSRVTGGADATRTTSGTLEASYELTSQGAASYVLPITVPPGTGGVQPDLALGYNSQARDGIVGFGFSLQGLLSIQRCAAVQGIDGFNGGVHLDADDRFCLGDQRLILISGGRYGDPDTVYHTAAESWTEIRARGRCGSGPCSFTVTGPDGNVTAFGTTTQARALVPGQAEVYAWFAETATDHHGNRLAVSYETVQPSGQVLPQRISYTSNPGLTPPLAAQRAVRFEYEPRDTGTFGDRYRAGLRYASDRLLSAVVTEVDGAPVLRYSLDYEKTARPGRYLLSSVELCDGAGELCLPPTRFTWQSGDPRVESPNSNADGILRTGWCRGDDARPDHADFNGDGREDLTCRVGGTHQVLLSTGTGLVSPNSDPQGVVRTGWCADGETGWSDFNGDGRADLHCDTDDGDHAVLISTGDALTSPNSQPDGLLRTDWCPADSGGTTCSTRWFNYARTGRSDAVCDCSDGRHFVLLSTGDSLVSDSSQPDGLILSNWCVGGEVTWADFDGDGRADLNCRDETRRTLSVMLSTPDGPRPANSNAGGEVRRNWCVDSDSQFGHADFNADFLADAYCHRDGTQQVLLSTGTTLESPTSQPDGTLQTGYCRDGGVIWSDFDADGLADLQCVGDNGDQSVLVSDGTGLVSPTSQPDGLIMPDWCDPEQALPGRFDFNGDGLGDFGCQRANGEQAVLVHAPGQGALLARAENGLGGFVEWDYGYLAEGAGEWYTPGEDLEYPQVAVTEPFGVVRHLRVGDGRGNVIASEYRYADGRIDLEQQVFLGFREIVRIDPAIGRRTTTVHALDYPLVGFVEEVTVSGPSSAGGAEVPWQRSVSTPVVREVHPDVWFVATASNQRTNFDPAGRAAFTVGLRFEYDAFGNRNLLADLGSVADPDDDNFLCSVHLNQRSPWRIGFERASKVTRTEAACRSFLAAWPDVSWDSAVDLRWSRTEYGPDFSVSEEAAWDDTLSTWLTRRYGYDGAGNQVTVVDEAGETWRATYDDTFRSFVAETRTPPDNAGEPLVETFRNDPAFGHQTGTTDANGNRFTTLYDGLGREMERWGPPPEGGDATVRLATFTYGGSEAAGWYVEERQRVTWDDGDPADWNYRRIFLDGLERQWQIRQRSWSGDDVVVDFRYDAQGRPWRQSFPRFASQTVPGWRVTTYDLLDRTLSFTRADGTVSRTEFLDGGLRVVTTLAADTPDARRTTSHFDPRENLVGAEAANGGLMTYGYDRLSQRVLERNPVGAETRFVYDSLGRVTRRQGSDTGVGTQVFDAAGRLAEATDGVGNVTGFTYDALSRVTRRSSRSPSGEALVYDLSYDGADVANARGLPSRIDGPESRVEYGYDAYGSHATTRQTIGGESHVRQALVSPLDVELKVTVDGGPTLSRQLYPDGSVARVDFSPAADAAATPMVAITGYTALYQVTGMSYGNDTASRYSYLPADQAPGWLKTWSVEGADGANLSRVEYSWNRVGQVARVDESEDGGLAQTQTYGYDSTGWLVSAEGPFGNLSYEYDLAGNLTLKDGVRYTLKPDSDHLATGSNGLVAGYRADGTLESLAGTGESWRYRYDPAARLEAVEMDGAEVMSALYDVEGRRLRRTDADGTVSRYFFGDWDTQTVGGVTTATFYVVAGDELVAAVTDPLDAAGSRAAELAAAASLYRSGTVSWWRLRAASAAAGLAGFDPGLAPVRAGIAGLAFLAALAALLLTLIQHRRRRALPWWQGLPVPLLIATLLLLPVPAGADLGPGGGIPQSGTLYFHQNVVESVAFTTDSSGGRSSRVAYLPYGEVDAPRSSGPDDFRPKFTAHERDVDSGLYDYGQRYYHPGIGRFLQPDPEAQFVSPYTYVGNNPLSAVDPDGTIAGIVVALVVAAVVGAAVGAYFGAAAANDDYNPAHWDWTSGKTWGGMVAGAVVGAASAALGVAAWTAGPAVGIAADVVLGSLENVFFTALSTTDPQELAMAAVTGAVFGGVFAVGGVLVSRGASAARRGVSRAIARGEQRALRGASGSAVNTLAGDAAERGAGRAGRNLDGPRPVSSLGGCSSFPAGVPVVGDDGSVSVEAVAVGLEVVALTAPEAVPEEHRVLSLLSREVAELTVVALRGEEIPTTAEHPFWTVERGWVESADLAVGDLLLAADGRAVPVLGVSRRAGPATVYNFEVAEAQTYFVGRHQVLVHNPKCKLSKLPPTKTMTTARQKKLWKNKLSDLVQNYGDRQVWYRDPVRGRRLLDLESYAVRISGKRARVSLNKFGKGSTRSQHFRFADRRFKVKKGRVIGGVKSTWHHHPTRKQMDLVPTGLHKRLGHAGGIKHLF